MMQSGHGQSIHTWHWRENQRYRKNKAEISVACGAASAFASATTNSIPSENSQTQMNYTTHLSEVHFIYLNAQTGELELKRICNGICKQFRVLKPHTGSRYQAGQGRCQTCDIWIDYRGAHTRDKKPITKKSEGWFCNCCNYRIRRNPRNIEYKTKIRASSIARTRDGEVDLSYFNKRRARMLRDLGRAIVKTASKGSRKRMDDLLPNQAKTTDIEFEFDVGIDKLLDLAHANNPPNKVFMIADFERVRHAVGRTPTKQDAEAHFVLSVSQYEKEFGSWEVLLDRLGYDPWYRHGPS